MQPDIQQMPSVTQAEYKQAEREFIDSMGILDRLKLEAKGLAIGVLNPINTLQHLLAPERIRRELTKSLGKTRPDRGPMDKALNYAGAYDYGIRPGINAEDAATMAKLYQLRDFTDRPEDSIYDYLENMAGLRAAERDRAAGVDRRGKAINAEAVRYGRQEQGKARGGLARLKGGSPRV